MAQTTYQRFFLRYWRLCGISGTLWEARAELRQVYGAQVLRVPLHQASRREDGPLRQFDSTTARFEAAVPRVAALHAQGRPVLVGTNSVAESQLLSARLLAAGLAHRVLNALNDADEAAIVAQAGQAGRITVATRMAGRGTDIELDDAARAAGGLHVLSCQDNPSRRLDRQLAGRAGRQGEPGSTEIWALTPGAIQFPSETADSPPWTSPAPSPATPWFAPFCRRWNQRNEEHRRAALRQLLLEQDRHWDDRLAFAGSSG